MLAAGWTKDEFGWAEYLAQTGDVAATDDAFRKVCLVSVVFCGSILTLLFCNFIYVMFLRLITFHVYGTVEITFLFVVISFVYVVIVCC